MSRALDLALQIAAASGPLVHLASQERDMTAELDRMSKLISLLKVVHRNPGPITLSGDPKFAFDMVSQAILYNNGPAERIDLGMDIHKGLLNDPRIVERYDRAGATFMGVPIYIDSELGHNEFKIR